ncbi:MAG: DeoR/GlpR family DNA-binding transcription regulator [Planctomycetaceae bacterium]
MIAIGVESLVQPHDRRHHLLDLIRVRGFASLEELVREIGVSESTVRRDLDALEQQGAVRRTHGGVLASAGGLRGEFDDRQPVNWSAKRAIAAVAAGRIQDGETVLLDGGTTTYEVARLLVGRSLQVVTNSLPVANLFASQSRSDLVLLGGYVSPRSGVCLGPYANELLSRLHVATTVLSAAGIAEDGLYNAHLLLAESEQAMLRAAGRVIVVADSSKFGMRSLTHVAELQRINLVVSDDGLSSEWRDTISAAGPELAIASLRTESGDHRGDGLSPSQAPETGGARQCPRASPLLGLLDRTSSGSSARSWSVREACRKRGPMPGIGDPNSSSASRPATVT